MVTLSHTILLIIIVILLIYNFEFLGVMITIPVVLFAMYSAMKQRSITGGSDDRKPRTYVLDTKLIPEEILRKYLSGWRQIPARIRPKYVDLVLGVTSGSRQLYGTKAKLKARADAAEITDKVKFHEHMAKINPAAIAATVEVTPETELPEGAIWMVRANWGWKGKASGVATTTAELQSLREKFNDIPDNAPGGWKKGMTPRVIGSEYIQDPLLWKGFKFHVRVHVIAVILTDRRYAAMMPTVEIIPAGKPYVNGEYSDPDIHDTHDDRNNLSGILEKDMENGDQLRRNLIDMLRKTVPQLLPLIKLYPESENAYEVFGLDVMFHSDGSPVLIEFNSGPGMIDDPNDQRITFVNDEVINAIFATGFSDVFYPAGDRSSLVML